MTSPTKPDAPATPGRPDRAGASNGASTTDNNGTTVGLGGTEETPYSIKKRMASNPSSSGIVPPPLKFTSGGAISPSKYASSTVKSPSKLRTMSKFLTPEQLAPGPGDDDDDDDEEMPDTPTKRAPRTPASASQRQMRSRADAQDHSARRRARDVIRKSQADDGDDVDETEVRLAEKIIAESYEDDDGDSDYDPEPETSSGKRARAAADDNDDEEDEDFSEGEAAPSTKKRGGARKPAAAKARRTTTAKNKNVWRRPSPPADVDADDDDFKGTDIMAALFLDGYEGYFDQHKTRDKISTVPFSRAPTVEFKEFIQNVDLSRTFYRDSRDFLLSLYRTMFTQWYFELSQGYSLLFYGVGSKRNLLLEFVTSTIPEEIPVLVVNGYNPATSFKELLNSLIPILIEDNSLKLPKNTPDLLQVTLDYLESKRKAPSTGLYKPKVVLLVHNIDGESLRSDKTQAFLSKLSSAKEIWIVATIDHISAPIMWDAAKLALYNFLWHDLTTYESYAIETSFDDALALGKVRTAAGNKGVKYVLSSLTMKARGLYRVLICHQIETMSTELHGTADDQRNVAGTALYGIEFKLLYQKCVEEFIVSNELNFRTMLTEFIDHKMAVITKDQSGTEIVYIPYTKETMERILEEDLMD